MPIDAGDHTSAQRAPRVAKELKAENKTALAGQDCNPGPIDEMRTHGTRLTGSVVARGANPCPRVIDLGIILVRGKYIPPYNYVERKRVTAESMMNCVVSAEVHQLRIFRHT